MTSDAQFQFVTDCNTSRRMARIRQKGTTGELTVRTALRNLGISYRLNVRSLPGSPDLANKSRKFAIFVQGCYWHHHTGCTKATVPKRNVGFWQEKFTDNRKRDARSVRELRRNGYKVLVIWECQVSDFRHLRQRYLTRLLTPPESCKA
jgi:DNA mismatch endonuclease Vsr